jgi:hypothetical protein
MPIIKSNTTTEKDRWDGKLGGYGGGFTRSFKFCKKFKVLHVLFFLSTFLAGLLILAKNLRFYKI